MDSLAHFRRANGRNALSINWGPWDEIGMAASLNSHDKGRMTDRGINPIAPDDGLQVMDSLLDLHVTQVTVMPVRWSRLLQSYGLGQEPPILEVMAREVRPRKKTEPTTGGDGEFKRRLEGAPESERLDILTSFVTLQVAKIMGLDPKHQFDLRAPFMNLGLDSLMAVELRNALAEAMGHSLQTSLVYDHPTIEALSHYLGQELLGIQTDTSKDEKPSADEKHWNDLSVELDELSQEELANLLAESVSSFEKE
jgi:acyl carrier protein